MISLFPSLISADLLNLAQEIKKLDPYVAGYHLDVMDFHFVPNLTFGPDWVNQIRAATNKPLYVHLMVEYPEKYMSRFILNPSDTIAIHYESPSYKTPAELLKIIGDLGYQPGLALNPSTSVDKIFPLKGLFNSLLIMAVEPGFSGQAFLPNTLEKLALIGAWKKKEQLSFSLAVDGGISATTASQVTSLGATHLAVASAIFSSSDRIEALKKILKNIDY